MKLQLLLCLLVSFSTYWLPSSTTEVINNLPFFKSFAINRNRKYLEDNSIDSLYEDVYRTKNACKDFYSLTCNKTKFEAYTADEFSSKSTEIYELFYSKIEDILDESDNDFKPLLIEQQLIKNCLKLEESSEEKTKSIGWKSIEDAFNDILREFDHEFVTKNYESWNEIPWQKLEGKLAELRPGYTFFDFNVMRNPGNPSKNIIILEPPSMKYWNSQKLSNLMNQIFLGIQLNKHRILCESNEEENSKEDFRQIKNSKSEEKIKVDESKEISSNDDVSGFLELSKEDNPIERENSESCTTLFNKKNNDYSREIVDEDDLEVIELFNDMLKNIFEYVTISNKDTHAHKSSDIQWWNEYYNKNTESKIDWVEMLKREFGKLGIAINDDEKIMIKNYQYFKHLPQLLKKSNKLIVRAIQVKFVAENIRYYNWKWINEKKSTDPFNLCLGETKLYGLTEKALSEFTKRRKPSKGMHKVFKDVQSILYSGIYETSLDEQGFINRKGNYLIHELEAITENSFFETRNHQNHTSNYYKNFELTGKYLIDINDYRMMLRVNKFNRLRKKHESPYAGEPLSLNDMESPRNRMTFFTILNSMIIDSLLLDRHAEKEVYYATFGDRLAGFLLSLLSENPFERDFLNHEGSDLIETMFNWLNNWIVNYSSETVNCFIRENIVTYNSEGVGLTYKTVTDIFSSRIALEAMVKNSKDWSDEQFFSSFTEARCTKDIKYYKKHRKMTNKVLSNLAAWESTFNCMSFNREHSQCDINFTDNFKNIAYLTDNNRADHIGI